MTREEFDTKKDEMIKRHFSEVLKLRQEYVSANKKFNIGDVIQDQSSGIIIEVKEIKPNLNLATSGYPFNSYVGVQLNRDLTVRQHHHKLTINDNSESVIKLK